MSRCELRSLEWVSGLGGGNAVSQIRNVKVVEDLGHVLVCFLSEANEIWYILGPQKLVIQ